MPDIRKKTEAAFERFGHFIYRRRWWAIVLITLLAGAMISQMPGITMDLSAEGLLDKHDPALVTYDAFRDQFGLDKMVIFGMEPGQVFSFPFLQKLKKFHHELEAIPNVEEVTSLINVTAIRGEDDTLVVEELLAEWPEDAAALAALKARVMAEPLYRDTLISADGRFTVVLVRPALHARDLGVDPLAGFAEDPDEPGPIPQKLNEQDKKELVDRILALAGRYRGPDFPLHIGGVVMMEEILKRVTKANMERFLVIASFLILLLLTLLFRRASGVFLPLLVVNLSLASALGLMAFFKVPITLNTQILPSFLLAVGIGDSIHLLAIFYRDYNRHGNREQAISYAMGHAGLALLMTSLTTAGGLLSFVSAGIAPIANLGIFAALGVILALVYTLVLLPALLAVLPIRRQADVDPRKLPGLDRFLLGCGDLANSHPWPVILVSGLLLVFSFASALQLKFSHSSITYLPVHSEVRQACHLIDKRMGGSINLEILVDTGREDGLLEPEIMTDLDRAATYAEGLEMAGIKLGRALSVAGRVKDINQTLHGDRPEYYRIPGSRELIAQELLLFENGGTDDLEKQVDSRYRLARVSIRGPWVDAIGYVRVLKHLHEKFSSTFGQRATITVTGITNLMCRTFSAIIHSMATSYLIAGVVITLLMIVMLGSLPLGLMSMVPNLLPIVMALGGMYWLKIPLDVSSIMIGSIAIGLAVDDTVHFMHHFRRYHGRSNDVRQAIHDTLTTAGRAMLFTSMILCAGFFVLMLSDQRNLQDFGLVAGSTIIFALFADLLLTPALMTLIYRGKSK
ncbi:MAG: efflux RND transporter permease subunit [Desulfobacterales bacterium]|nr:efflux RND transporter permease subunit [Desulfobacterales bacterium]